MIDMRNNNTMTDRLLHVLTGAMHEETCIPGVLTLRDNTGRPVETGSNALAGTEAMIRCARSMLERGSRWKNPIGDGKAGERIGRVMGIKEEAVGENINRSAEF